MIIIMKPGASRSNIDHVIGMIEEKGLNAHLSEGSQVTIIGVVGDKTKLAHSNIEIAPGVDHIVPVTESYKLTNKTVMGLCIMHSICMENKISFVHQSQIILAIYSDFYCN